MTKVHSLLIVEDSPPMAQAYQEFLRHDCYRVHCVETLAAARRALEQMQPTAVLLDVQLPDGNGLDIVAEIRHSTLQCAVVAMTAHGSVDTAVTALKLGVDDFLEKPFNAERLRTTLANALEKRRLTRLVDDYEKGTDRQTFQGFIGSSLPMQAMYNMIESAAPSKASVFITGESGTGKEVLAKAIHDLSPRCQQHFISLNCGAIPRDLIESEFFGHMKGAFTGAVKERKGAALLADGGTLFLDELCEMDLALQVKLLRFLQSETFRPVGSDEEIQVNVRIIAATNKDPRLEVREGRFREDLFYRLHVIGMELPPLRERGNDVLLMANQLLLQYSLEENKQFKTLDQETVNLLLQYSWPGNIRELQNVLRQGVVLNDGFSLSVDMLPAELRQAPCNKPSTLIKTQQKFRDAPILPLQEMEEEHIQRALDYCENNIGKAAALLEVSPSTLYRRIKSSSADLR